MPADPVVDSSTLSERRYFDVVRRHFNIVSTSMSNFADRAGVDADQVLLEQLVLGQVRVGGVGWRLLLRNHLIDSLGNSDFPNLLRSRVRFRTLFRQLLREEIG